MANMFNEDGTYNKTEWKSGDRITAVKLNKIELSLEAINNNDIERHVEADSRLDALTEELETIRLELSRYEELLKYLIENGGVLEKEVFNATTKNGDILVTKNGDNLIYRGVMM